MAAATALTRLHLICDGTRLDLASMQGLWTQAQYLRLTDHCRQLLEFTDGRLEVLPTPTRGHQAISRYLLRAWLPVVQAIGGELFDAPLRLRIREGKFREPDLLLLRDAQDPRNRDDYWRGADLLAEIVSADDPERDTREKRLDYAEAGIPEYWIVNPLDETVTVLTLQGETYAEHGIFRRGERAESALIDALAADVAEVFDAGLARTD